MSTPLDKLTHELSKLPSVGSKTALRLALHILRQPAEYGQSLAKAIQDTLLTMRFCEDCFNISVEPRCRICVSSQRLHETICVVEEVSDLMALENTHCFKGVYHVLHGSLSPMDGVGPDELKIHALIKRLERQNNTQEIILATNPNVNGDATALYISRLLRDMSHLKITKLASGIPVGSHIEFIDNNTLSRALEQRGLF